MRHVGQSERAAANAYNTVESGDSNSPYSPSAIKCPVSAVGIISRQLELTLVAFPIPVVFPNSGYTPVAFTGLLSNIWLGTRRDGGPYSPVRIYQYQSNIRDGVAIEKDVPQSM
jgi:hypothetical protein